MAKKRSQIERAIDSLQADMDVLEMAMARLKQQQAAVTKRPCDRVSLAWATHQSRCLICGAPTRKPRAVKAPTIMNELMTSLKADKTA